jgi:acetoin utilization deacetylase AcuC-like enzyme
MGPMTVAYCYHPIHQEHAEFGHPENPQRLEAVMRVLEERGMLARLREVAATPASREQLLRVHTQDYLSLVERAAQGGGGHLDVDTYLTARSYDAACLAAGGLLNVMGAVLQGRATGGFALIRPPGHHALSYRAMGFCLFNNVGIAARAALAEFGVQRVLIVDWDVHHGNGTQEAFYADGSVLFFSTHQYPHYPGTGHWREQGEGAGQGLNVNVPLRAGVGDEGYTRVFDEVLAPLARRFGPDLILVSAGYDAHWRDPLASMQVTTKGFYRLAQRVKGLADELCGGRLVCALEGGYHLEALAYSVLATLQALAGDAGEPVDPLGAPPYDEKPVDDILATVKKANGLR